MHLFPITLLTLLSLMAKPDGKDGKDGDFEKALNDDVQQASVIVVASSGDLVLFGGAVTIPAKRPSVENCGEFFSMSAKAQAKHKRVLRKEAERAAMAKRYSKRDTFEYMKRAMGPIRRCEVKFRKACKEVRARLDQKVRIAAFESAKKSIELLTVSEAQKRVIRGYLDHVLAHCPQTGS